MHRQEESLSNHWQRRALSAALASIGAIAGGATAFEIDTGNPDVEMRWDNTVRYNLGVRTHSQDPAILGNPNADDGDRRCDDVRRPRRSWLDFAHIQDTF